MLFPFSCDSEVSSYTSLSSVTNIRSEGIRIGQNLSLLLMAVRGEGSLISYIKRSKMADAFENLGNGIFKGIELSEQEVRLRPKSKIIAKAVELHGKMFFSINPLAAGAVMFGVLIDGNPSRAFMNEYVSGTRFENKDIGVNRAYAFTYPAAGRTLGTHTVQIRLGKQVTTGSLKRLDTEWLSESPLYTVVVSEGEEQ